jgi:hypothetical protein
MVSISSPNSRTTTSRRGDSSRANANLAVSLLVFSLVGLLADGLALVMQGQASLAPLRFVLIAGAAPMAAMVALWFVGPADEVGS